MKKHSVKYQIKSFGWAFKGLTHFFTTETKAIIHSAALILVVLCGIFLGLSDIEWSIVCIVSGMVIIAEIFNTVIEKITDTIPDQYDLTRGKIKDMSAGAVLISSFIAAICGGFIFIPKLIELWT